MNKPTPTTPSHDAGQSMTPEAQRIAIAEACGHVWYKWGNAPEETNRFLCMPAKDEGSFIRCERPSHGRPINFTTLPNYCSSLDAMHEAEEFLLKVQVNKYLKHLRAVTGMDYFEEATEFRYIHATASQRAEAFLKCLNLWKSQPIAQSLPTR